MALMTGGKARWFSVAVLFAILTLCIAFSWNTRDSMSQLPFLRKQHTASSAESDAAVDLQPWQTAEALTALAPSSEEMRYAREAEHLADHEVDQAFAAALREASLKPQNPTPEALRLSRKIAALQGLVNSDQARVRALTAHDPDDDLDIATAQLALDTDQLNEAKQDVSRNGGDQGDRIKQELAAHEAAMKKYDARLSGQAPVAVDVVQQHPTLAGYLKSWLGERARYSLLQAAADQSKADAAALANRHADLEKHATPSTSVSGQDKASRLVQMAAQSTRTQLLGIYDDRIETLGQLADVYSKWSAQTVLAHRMTGHLMLQSFALIAFILICVLVCEAVVLHLAQSALLDQRSRQTMGTILQLAVQCAGVVLILLVIFGVPGQMPTILGLATAGLTVVLQDFIIAFLGWFVLMGKNGIRIGDWVEINGVTGEILSIGVFRSAMLETGKLADRGHPTGRRTTFMNSFAIKGQYFNFSTTGQWTWDELRLAIPAGRDAHEAIEAVRKEVAAETAKDTQAAEEEWKRVTRRNALTHFTPEPAVDMRPGASGIDMVVRYVVRASDRFEVRNRLYEKVLGILHASQ